MGVVPQAVGQQEQLEQNVKKIQSQDKTHMIKQIALWTAVGLAATRVVCTQRGLRERKTITLTTTAIWSHIVTPRLLSKPDTHLHLVYRMEVMENILAPIITAVLLFTSTAVMVAVKASLLKVFPPQMCGEHSVTV